MPDHHHAMETIKDYHNRYKLAWLKNFLGIVTRDLGSSPFFSRKLIRLLFPAQREEGRENNRGIVRGASHIEPHR
jgi:hypothetical protein